MSRLSEFKTRNGESIWVEVDEATAAHAGPTMRGMGPASAPALAEKASESFESALEKIRPAAEGIISNLRELSYAPTSVELEFGIKLNAVAGAVIASAATEANFRITLKWTTGDKKQG